MKKIVLVCCWSLVGNSDMHLKNFSLIETSPCSRTFRLSPAYDLLSVHLALPDDKEQMALTLNAKKSNIRVQDFMQLAKNIGLLENASKKIIRSVVNKIPDMIALCHKSYLNEDLQQKLIDIIHTNQKNYSIDFNIKCVLSKTHFFSPLSKFSMNSADNQDDILILESI